MALSSCHKPEFVESNADRQGLTSLTAIFTFGPYVNQELAKLTIEDDSQDRFVIPIPFYFPENTDDQTLIYMTKIRVQAQLQPNYKLSPSLGILDLTEDNKFTYTDPHGNSRTIVITGERVKSSANDITSFSIVSPKTIPGVINKETKVVVLPTKDDLNACAAEIGLSPHARISPDPSKPHNYNDGFKFTVTSDNGTSCEWTVQKGDPEKLPLGIDVNSREHLFNLDPVSRLGLPPYTDEIIPSIASVDGKFLVSIGDGNAPMVLNGLDGSFIGNLNLGSAACGSIANDEGGNLLIMNAAKGGDNMESENIYRTRSVSAEPELFYSFDNPVSYTIGHRVKVVGDIDGDAAIVFTGEGVAGVTSCGQVVVVKVEGGVPQEPVVFDFYTNNALAWGEAPVHYATVAPASTDIQNDGFFLDYYEGESQTDVNIDMLHWITGSYKDTQITTYGGDSAWALNANCLDVKSFNNCRYLAVFVVSHFPQWGMGPQLYLYDATDPSSLGLLMSNDGIEWYQKGAAGIAAGDVIMVPSADGFYLTVYYYDHNSAAIGAYRVDCIKR